MKKLLNSRYGLALVMLVVPGTITLQLSALFYAIDTTLLEFWEMYGAIFGAFGGWSIVAAILYALTKIDEDFVMKISSIFYYVWLGASYLISKWIGVSEDAGFLSPENLTALEMGFIFSVMVCWIVSLKRRIRKIQAGSSENKN